MLTTVNGRRVQYEEIGRGVPLVLIHGYPLSHEMWEQQLRGLAQDAHLLAPDLPGFGENEAMGSATMSAYAEFVHDLLAALKVTEPAVLCGLSMGGYVAFEYFRRHPEGVRGLVLANTKAGADGAEAQAGRDRSAAVAREQGVEAIANAMLPKMLAPQTYKAKKELVEQARRIMLSATVQGIVNALLAMKERPDSTPTLSQVRQPSLVIAGADDQLIPPEESRTMAKKLAKGRLAILSDAGHLSNMEQPDLFNRAVSDYLKTL